jgi:hypothetical protein
MTALRLRALRAVPPILILGYATLSILEMRSLHADGAWAFARGLISEGYWIGDPPRVVSNLLAQSPFAAVVALGVDDRLLLEYAHGVGYLLIPSAAWAAALYLSRRGRTFDFLLIGYCVTTLTSGFLAVGDYNFLFAFTALCFAAVLRFWSDRNRAMPWIALGSAFIVASSHGLAVMLAPLLIGAIVLPWRRFGRPTHGRAPLLATVAVLGVGTCVAAFSIARPYSPGNVLRAMDLSGPLLDNHQLQLTIVWLMLLPLAVLARSRGIRVATTAVLVAALLALAVLQPLWATPLQQYEARAWSGILLFLVLLLALLSTLPSLAEPVPSSAADPRTVDGRFALLSMGLLVGLLVPATIQTVQFGSFVRAFSAEINGRAGLIANAEFVAAVPAAERYGWLWAYPSMSLVLGEGPDHAFVLNQPQTIYQQPFEPERPPAIPARFAAP